MYQYAKKPTNTNSPNITPPAPKKTQALSGNPEPAWNLNAPMIQRLIQRSPLLREARRLTEADTASPSIQQTAQAGVQGQGQPLPHIEKLQPAFGERDLSQIQTYAGPQAQAAADAIGAKAYTTGNKIAFAEQNPDVHTVAHEAAHVFQQQAGVHLKDGIDQVNDPYENHANAVADKVVQGESVEAELAAVPRAQVQQGSSASAQVPVVQRVIELNGQKYSVVDGAVDVNEVVSDFKAKLSELARQYECEAHLEDMFMYLAEGSDQLANLVKLLTDAKTYTCKINSQNEFCRVLDDLWDGDVTEEEEQKKNEFVEQIASKPITNATLRAAEQKTPIPKQPVAFKDIKYKASGNITPYKTWVSEVLQKETLKNSYPESASCWEYAVLLGLREDLITEKEFKEAYDMKNLGKHEYNYDRVAGILLGYNDRRLEQDVKEERVQNFDENFSFQKGDIIIIPTNETYLAREPNQPVTHVVMALGKHSVDPSKVREVEDIINTNATVSIDNKFPPVDLFASHSDGKPGKAYVLKDIIRDYDGQGAATKRKEWKISTKLRETINT